MTRFLQGLALRERSLLPVLKPQLPGPFERSEPRVEPDGGELPAGAPSASPEPPIEAAPGLLVNERAPLHPTERRARPAVHDAPAVADALPEALPGRRSVAASRLALRSSGEAHSFPQSQPVSRPAGRVADRHAQPDAARRLEPAVQRVAAAPVASPALSERAPVAVPLEDGLPLRGRPEVRPATLPTWAIQAAVPSPGRALAGERRQAPVPLDAPASAPRAHADAKLQRHAAPPAAQPHQASLPQVALALPAAERSIKRPAQARPVQGSLEEAEPRQRLTTAVVLQAQMRPAAAGDAVGPALSAGPTVHVSIGRVEIRAAPAPAAAAGAASRGKAPARTPTLSLSDYLQQRGGAKRGNGGPGSAR